MGNRIGAIGRVVLIVVALAGLLGPVAGLVLPQPVFGSLAVLSELSPRVHIPLLIRPENTPTPTPTSTPTPTPIPSPTPTPSVTPTAGPLPELAIYDKYGTLQDWEWLVSVFGPYVTLVRGTDAAKVIELRQVEGDIALIAHVENIHGEPIVGQEVVFHWDGAPLLPPEKQACGEVRGDVILTKENGNAEFIMGGGAWYDPAVGVGPHQVWVPIAGTDCLHGLGWFDYHVHLDSVWRLP